MSVSPARLERVSTDDSESSEHKAFFGIANFGPHDTAENVRLTTARSTGTGAAQEFQPKIRFGSVVPLDRKLVADQLNVFRRHSHIRTLTSRIGENQSSESWVARNRIGVRGPKIAVPTRTNVAPSSIAIGKS